MIGNRVFRVSRRGSRTNSGGVRLTDEPLEIGQRSQELLAHAIPMLLAFRRLDPSQAAFGPRQRRGVRSLQAGRA